MRRFCSCDNFIVYCLLLLLFGMIWFGSELVSLFLLSLFFFLKKILGVKFSRDQACRDPDNYFNLRYAFFYWIPMCIQCSFILFSQLWLWSMEMINDNWFCAVKIMQLFYLFLLFEKGIVFIIAVRFHSNSTRKLQNYNLVPLTLIGVLWRMIQFNSVNNQSINELSWWRF